MNETPTQAIIGVSRRQILAGAAGIAGAAVVGFGAKPAGAVSLWVVAAGSNGALTTNWHNDSFTGAQSALDIGVAANG